MSEEILSCLNQAEPPQEMAPPLQALWWLKKGNLEMGPEWEKGHNICQTAEGTMAYDWVHALAHWIEGDMGNANYWYRGINKKPGAENISDEWDFISAAMSK